MDGLIGVKNPILLADAIRQKDELGRLDFGLVPPMYVYRPFDLS